MGSWVDGDTSDDGRHPDVHPLAGVRVRFELSHRVLVSQFGGHREIHLKRPVLATDIGTTGLPRLDLDAPPGTGHIIVALAYSRYPATLSLDGTPMTREAGNSQPLRAVHVYSAPHGPGPVVLTADIGAQEPTAGWVMAVYAVNRRLAVAHSAWWGPHGYKALDFQHTGQVTVCAHVRDGGTWTFEEPGVPDYVQPTGAHDAYNTGDQVRFEGQVWESLIDGNAWTPAAYPQGWKLIS